MSQYFSIQLTTTDTWNPPYVLCYNTWGDSRGSLLLWQQQLQASTITPQKGGASFGNQQWSISWDGYICSAIDSDLFLTLDGSNSTVTLAAIGPGQIQQWVILSGGGGTAMIATKESYAAWLANRNSGSPPQIQVLSVEGSPGNGSVLTTNGQDYPGTAATPMQQWSILPCFTVVDQWTTIKSQQSPDGEDLLVSLPMKVSGDLKSGHSLDIMPTSTQAIVAPRVAFGNGSTWQLTATGCLVNAWNSELVLTAGVDSSGDLDGTVWVFPSTASPPPPNQVWIVSQRGVLVSLATQAGGTVCALTAQMQGEAPESGAQLTMTPYTQGWPTPGQQWEFFPGLALQTLLAQPPVAFPTLNSTTYDYIEKQLWPTKTITVAGGGTKTVGGPPPGGLRPQYTNLAAPLASFQSQILAIPNPNPPAGSPSTYPDWDEVVSQLVAELTAAQAVQNLFQQMSLVALELTQAQSLVLNDIAAELQVAPATTLKAKFKWGQFVMGIVYSALNIGAGLATMGESSAIKTLASTGISAVANLLQTAFNSTQLKSEREQPKDAGFNTYAQMEASLLLAFEQIEEEIAAIEEMVLTDWRKLQIFYDMCLVPSGVDSLFWPSKATPSQARKMLPGYIDQVLKALIPTNDKYLINSYSFESGTATAGLAVDMSASSPSQTYIAINTPLTTESTGGSTFNTYTKYESSWPARLVDYILESGATFNSVFRGIDGWQVPIKEQLATGGCCYVLIRNATDTQFYLNLSGSGVNGQDDKDSQNYYANLGSYGLVIAAVTGSSKDGSVLYVTFYTEDNTSWGGATFFTNGDYSITTPHATYSVDVTLLKPSNQSLWTFVLTFGYA